MMQRTFVIIKPLGLQNFLVEILGTIRGAGTITHRRLVPVSPELIETHYAEHKGKTFFPRLTQYYQGETVMALVVEGPGVVSRVRDLVGPSDPRRTKPGHIRNLVMDRWKDGQAGWSKIELATSGVDNLVHASDSAQAAEREIELWFPGGGQEAALNPGDRRRGRW